jgi:hypothetical protein
MTWRPYILSRSLLQEMAYSSDMGPRGLSSNGGNAILQSEVLHNMVFNKSAPVMDSEESAHGGDVMVSTQTRWQIVGDYFENCNCAVVCPCTISPHQPLTSNPTKEACELAFAIHITRGSYGDVTLDGQNVAMIASTPGPMSEGNWSVALYLDERANEQQRQGIEAIFSGSAGGPLGALAPFISTMLGVKTVPITFKIVGKRRSLEIPNIMHLAVRPLPSMDPNYEIWALNAHPFATQVAMAVGDQNSTWTDYGMSWDNSGKNGHYATINWFNS